MRFSNDYLKHDPRLYRHVEPAPLDNPRLVALNQPLIDHLALDLSQDDWRDVISGKLSALARISPHRLQPIAMAYAGHQFGQWAGQLGDGRGILIAQLKNDDGTFTDLHLKGAGRTPYSRHGDGRAMIDSSIREYLGAHALNHLGIPSSNAIGLVVSDTLIMRRHYEPAAALLRVSDCHVRLGHFEWVAMYAPDYFDKFVSHIAQSYYPHLCDAKTKQVDIGQLLSEIAMNTATMIADWQLIGFCHGVMNTDNLNITGTTLDFGPFGFMEGFNPTWINNHSDHQGRYVYQNQPMIGHWNLSTVYRSFHNYSTKADIDTALDAYEKTLNDRYHHRLCQKLGLDGTDQSLIHLGYRLLSLMQAHELDYTNTFRALIAVMDDGKDRSKYAHEYQLLAEIGDTLPVAAYEDWRLWMTDYRHQMRVFKPSVIISTLAATNPVYVLRNHMAQKAITKAHAGDFDEVHRLFDLLSTPHQTQAIATAEDTHKATADESVAVSCMS